MKNAFKRIFTFPRPELERFWWHRMLKILIFVSTAIVFLFSIHWANDFFKPYVVYSFNQNFSQYTKQYRTEDCSVSNLCAENADFFVGSYSLSGQPGAEDYVTNLDNQGLNSDQIVQKMQTDGLLYNLKAVDLQNDFYGTYEEIIYIILLPLLWYLVSVQLLYRIVVYIIVGRINPKKRTHDE